MSNLKRVLTKKDVIAFNQKFDQGHFQNESSLDFALASLKENIPWTKKTANLLRAILIDHVFEEGNKRTACAVLLYYIEYEGYRMEEKTAIRIVKSILLKNVTSIKKIRSMIEDGITRKDR